MKSVINTIILLLCSIHFVQAQSIKQQQQAQRRYEQQQQQAQREQREREQKEEARIKKGQLNFGDLISLQSKDVKYVDDFLTKKGWIFYSTSVENDEESEETSSYKSATWAFDKNTYNDLAKGWFYYYTNPTYDNAVSYRVADELLLDKIKEEIISSGYQRIQPTDVIERGLESVYRNGTYQVTIKKLLKKEDEEGANIRYDIFILNYKQLQERKAEEAKLAREASERQAKYDDAVATAKQAEGLKQYLMAKQSYIEAIEIKPESKELFSKKIAEMDIYILCDEAEGFLKRQQYEKAKNKYEEALAIKPNPKEDIISAKIKEIANFQQFLKQRKESYYDYKTLESADYEAKDDYIKTTIKNALNERGKSISPFSVKITATIDTLGNTTSSYETSTDDKKLNALLDKLNSDMKLNASLMNGYTTSAKADFLYEISYNHEVLSVRHSPNGIHSKSKDFDTYGEKIVEELNGGAPYGKYSYDMNTTIINDKVFNEHTLMNLTNHRSGSNAFLSLLVPGLGDHRVSYGEVSGIGTALSTYAFIGAGIGLKAYSNSEYKKYHNATKQEEIDDHYKKANTANQAFYGCLVAAGSIWLYDIIWVTVKGIQNTNKANSYMRSHIGGYYAPTLKATGLSYSIHF